MVGVIKGILTTIGGFFLFGGQPITVLNLLGVSLNTAGGALYAYAKYQEKQQSKQSLRAAGSKPMIEMPTTTTSGEESPREPLLPQVDTRTTAPSR